MGDDPSELSRRKREHLDLFRSGGVDARYCGTWLDCVRLVHCACPEIAVSELDLSVCFAGRTLRAPFFVTGMTGGTEAAARLNRELAAVAGRLGIAFGLGSQRAMLADPTLAATYRVRDAAPDVFLAGNLGGTTLARTPLDRVARMLEAVGADALCVHLNPAQELVQPEGDRDFRGVLDAIAGAVRGLPVPVIVKEVGCGLSREVATRLADAGVRHVDVAGLGGTSFVGVEVLRGEAREDSGAAALWDWGIPTAAAVAEVAGLGLEVVASGGVRTGLDAARAIALGADLAGLASPVVQAWLRGGEAEAERVLRGVIEGLAVVLVLTGSRTVADLRAAPRVLADPLLGWVRRRGLEAVVGRPGR